MLAIPSSIRLLGLPRIAFLATTASLSALPVANNDSFSLNEDETLTISGGGVIISASFEQGGSVLGNSWRYLDQLENENGAQHDYPVDAGSNPWNSPAFDDSTSTIGTWSTGTAPLSGGAIDGFPPGTPEILGGVSAAGNGQNLVTTYLFRQTFTLSPDQAAETTWILENLMDDGGIVYLNGTEIYRTPTVPAGPITTTTLVGVADEVNPLTASVDLTGILVEGENTIAVEVHQNSLISSDIGFSLSLTPAADSPSGGFTYVDDPFNGTNQPDFAFGNVDPTGGFTGSGLFVEAGGQPPGNASASGGWTRSFTLGVPATATVSFRYRFFFEDGHENDEYGQAIFEIDGVKYGNDTDDSLTHFQGDGNGGAGDNDTGWQLVTFDIPLGVGDHTLTLGAFSSKSTVASEITRAWFDDIEVSVPATGGGILSNDTGDNPTSILVSNASNGSVTLNTDGSFTYDPDPDFNGLDSFTYKANDPSGDSNTATVSLQINPVNDRPIALADNYSGIEGATILQSAPGVLVNDTDIEADGLSAVLQSDVSDGVLQLNSNGSFTYTPNNGFFGTDSFTYLANDGSANSDPVLVTLDVLPINDPPTAVDDQYTIVENSQISISISSGLEEVVFSSDFNGGSIPPEITGAGTLENIQGFDGLGPNGNTFSGQFLRNAASGNPAEPITVTLTDLPPHETISLRFLLSIIDAWNSNNDLFNVTVDGVSVFRKYFRNNRILQGFDYPVGTLIVRDQELAFSAGTNNQRDAGYDMSRAPELRDIPHTASSVTISFFADGSNWEGGDNESWAIDNLEVVLSSSPVETLVARGATWSYLDNGTDQGTAWRELGFDDTTWASGPSQLGYGDGDEATVVGFGPNSGSKFITTYFRHTFTVNDVNEFGPLTLGLIRDDGAAIYLNGTPVARTDLGAGATFDTLAIDDGGLTDENTLSEFTIPEGLLVEGENVLAVEVHQDNPTSSDISMEAYLVGKRATAAGVLSNDVDPENDRLTAEKLSDPAHGNLLFNADGTFTYTPDVNYEGQDSFTYRVSDGEFHSPPATVTITMTPGPGDFPVTTTDSYFGTEDTPLVVSIAEGVLANDTDPDSPLLSATVDSPPINGTLLLGGFGGFTYTPDPDFSGVDFFYYRASDGTNTSQPEVVFLNIASINDPPTALADSYLTVPDQLLLVDSANGVLANDSDPDNPTLQAQLVTTTNSGSLSLASNGSFTYNPNVGFSGIDSFSYRASDGLVNSETVTVTIRVDAPPVANDDVYTINENHPLTTLPATGILANDVDADPITAFLVSGPSSGSLSMIPDGSFIYIPSGNFSGAVSFTYRANDGNQDSNLATVTINITGSNDRPDAEDDAYEVEMNQVLNIGAAQGVLANDFDADGESLTATLVGNVSNGILTLQPDGSFIYEPNPGFIGTDQFVYTAADNSSNSGETVVEIEVDDVKKNIVINEIMFNPASGNDLDEFIELTNIGTTPISLLNWQFTNGISFTFPDVTVAPGEFLVIAADTTTFESTYGALPNVIGNWTGKLSNSGERIRLADETGVEIDEVEYYDQGDWAVRERITTGGEDGWSWSSDADGAGSSLELVNPSLSNKHGQNWSASLNNAPTPTFANSTHSDDTAPVILDVEHFPVIPSSEDPIGIVAKLRDEFAETVGATLYYRISTSSPGAFQSAPMLDDGYHCDARPNDGIFGFVHPPLPEGTVLEFYIESTDGTNTRTWPAPSTTGQTANALLQVDNEANNFDHGFYRLILPTTELSQWNSINRQSNAMMNATVILDDGTGPKIRYRAGMRVRGAGSRNHTPPPMRVALPRDTPWRGMTTMNLNTKFTYLQFLGMKLFQASNMRAPDTYRVQVRLNGDDLARNDNFDYGSMVHVQPLSEEFIDDKFEPDDGGNLYKKVRPDREFRWRDGDVAGYEADGWSKQTNGSINDWTDLDELLRVMNTTSGEAGYIQQVEAVADIDQWMNWFAAMAILANGETNISNGADDDYSMYRGANDPRFVFIPHDLDTILSIGDGSRNEDPTHTIFDMIEDDDVLDPLVPFFNHPEIRERYFFALRNLLQTSFSKQRFDELLDSQLTGWVPTAQIEQMRNFMDTRRIYIEGIISQEIGPPDVLPLATSSDSLALAHGNLYLSEVLAINNSQQVNGAYPDLIEIHNSGPTNIVIGGMSLSDDPSNPARYVFPGGTTIPAGEYLVVQGGSSPGGPGIYTGFNLDGNGESLSLFDTVANGSALLDSISFGMQIPDHSIGRTGPGSTIWKLCSPTFGAPNEEAHMGSPSVLRINEWLTDAVEVLDEEFVEIYNSSGLPVSLGDLSVSDEPVNYPQKHTLPPLSFVAPYDFSLLLPLGNDANPDKADQLPFKLASGNEWFALFGNNGVLIDQVHFSTQTADLSFGRVPDGTYNYRALEFPTPSYSNTAPFSNENLLVRFLRISEIMYDPSGGSDLEFIELQNTGGSPLDLGGLAFTEGIDFELPDMLLQPGEFILVVRNRTAFENFYGNGLPVIGEYGGKLDNGGERLRLEITDLRVAIHDFEYDDWFPASDGDGFSLDFSDTTLPRSAWHIKDNWAPSLTLNGTPGASGTLSVDLPDQLFVSLPNNLSITPTISSGPFSPTAITYEWTTLAGPAFMSVAVPAQGTAEVSFTQPGIYTLSLSVEAFGYKQSRIITINTYDTYEAWADRWFGFHFPGFTEMNDDLDEDGLSNFLEFAYLTNPIVPDQPSLPLPTFDRDENALSVTYAPNFVDPARYEISAQVSTAGDEWTSDSNEISFQTLSENYGFRTIRALDQTQANSTRTRFMRLGVKEK